MAKCLNCEDNAVFLVKNQGTLEQEFCDVHLPKMFNRNSLPNIVHVINAVTPYDSLRAEKEAEVEAVREKTKAKKKAEAEAEVVVEETPAE